MISVISHPLADLRTAVLILVAAAMLPLASFAQTYTWNQTTSANWSVATWDPGVPPVGGSTTTGLVFNNSLAAGYTATNDLAGAFILNSLTLNNTGTGAIILAAGAVGSPSLSFGGTLPLLLLSGTGAATISIPIALTTATTFTNSGTGLLTVSGALANGGNALTVNGSGNVTLSGIHSGTGGLIMSGTGTLTASGASTYTGATFVNSGVLKAGVASVAGVSGAFGRDSAITLANVAGARLDITGFATRIGSLTGGGNLGGNVTLGAAALTVGGDNTSPAAYAGVISGTGSLTKIGTGTLTLTGANTYTGQTNVNGGVLVLPVGGSITSTAGIYAGQATAAGELRIEGGSITSSISNVRALDISFTAASPGTFTMSAGSVNLTGAASGIVLGEASVALWNQTGGTVTLAGTGGFYTGNLVNGITTMNISGGTITANSSNLNLGQRANTTFNLSNTAVTSFGGINAGGSAISNNILNLGDGVNFTGGSSLATGGTSGLFIVGAMNRVTTFNATVAVNFNGGTIRARIASTVFMPANFSTASVLESGGAIDNNNFAITIAQAFGHGGIAPIDGGLIYKGAGTTTLTGLSTYTGPTIIRAGTVATGVSGAVFGTGPLSLSPLSGTVTLNVGDFSPIVSGLTFNGAAGTTTAVTAGAGTLVLAGDVSFPGTNNPNASIITPIIDLNGAARTFTVGTTTAAAIGLTLDGAVTDSSFGAASFVKAGPGTLAFNASNTYTGDTSVNGGTLLVKGGTSQAGGFAFANGTTLSIVNTGSTSTTTLAGNVSFGAIAGQSTTIRLATGSDWVINAPPVLAVGGTLAANGGANSTTVSITSTATIGLGVYNLIGYSGSIGGTGFGAFVLGPLANPRLVANLQNVANVIQLNVTGLDTPKWTGAIPGGVWDINTTPNWQLINAGTPTNYLEGDDVLFDNTATLTTVSLNAIVHPSFVTFTNASPVVYSLTGTGKISGAAIFTVNGGGTVILANANDYTGGTTITSGTLQLGNGVSSGNITGAVVNNAVLAFHPAPAGVNFTGAVTGSGAINVQGANESTFTGSIAVTGLTTVASTAILQLGNGTTTGTVSGDIAVDGTLKLNPGASDLTLGGILSGSGSINKIGAGTAIVTGASTFTGTTTITLGTLQIGDGNTVGVSFADSGIITHGTLAFHNGIDYATYAGAISGTGGVLKTGPNPLTLTGANSYQGPTSVQGGTLTVNSIGTSGTPGNLGTGSALNLSGGAILQYTGGSTTASPVMTIGTGGGTLSHATAATTLTLNGAISGNATMTVETIGDVTLGGIISGTMGLTKTDAGTLTLTAANTYAGLTNINGGTLVIPTGGGINSANTINVGGGVATGKLIISGGNVATSVNNVRALVVGSLSNGDFEISGGSVLLTGAGSGVVLGDNISGINGFPATWTQTGGTVTLGGTGIFYTGNIVGGVTTLDISGGTISAPNSPLNLGQRDNVTFNLSGPASVTFASISAGGSATSTNVLNLGDGLTFSGGTSINDGGTSGLFTVGAMARVTTFNATVAVNFNGGTLRARVASTVFMPAAFSTASVLEAGGVIDNNGFAITIAQPFGHGGVAPIDGGLIFKGSNTTTLSSANTYLGPTVIAAGTLAVTGNNSAATGNVAVRGGATEGGTLRGTGTLGGAVTVQGGTVPGTIRPGVTGIGTLTLANGLTIADGGQLGIDLTGTATPAAANSGLSTIGTLPNPTSNSYYNILGGTTSIHDNSQVVVTATSVTFTPGQSYSYLIAGGAGNQSSLDITFPGQFTFTGVMVNPSNVSLTGDSSGNVYLNFTVVVPEPGWALIPALALGRIASRRRRI